MGSRHSKPKHKRNNNGHGLRREPIGETSAASATPSADAQPNSQSNSNGSGRIMVRALYNYEAQHQDDLPFERGDFMNVQGNVNEPWWFAEHLTTQRRGYIPSNYVVVDDGRPNSLDAWYDIGRREADRLLLLMGNPTGTYIVRPSSSDPRHFALSVRYQPIEQENKWFVKHYKIRSRDNNEGYYIVPRHTFVAIRDLISYHSKSCDGLCCLLTLPCPRTYRPPVQFRDLEINRDSIRIVGDLGHGSFGEVKLAKWNNTVDVAVKLLKPNSMERAKFIGEAELLHKLHHKQIVQILGICTQPEDLPVYIVTELMEKGALLQYLQREGRTLEVKNLIDIMGQVAEGMAYLESMNFVHRDLRAANILVGSDRSVKVADFGLARVTEEDVYQSEDGAKFPVKWTAPEATLNHTFSVKSDVWSYGVLMYEIVTFGRTPYPGMTNRQVMDEVARGYRMPMPEGPNVKCTKELYELMLSCWRENPIMRPTFASLQDIFDNWGVRNDNNYSES